MGKDLPILDAHIHLDPTGTPKEAVDRFLSMGGTHLLIVHKPYHHININGLDDYVRSFETTVDMCQLANTKGCKAWCVIGPYPGELPHLADKMGFNEAVELQKCALEVAFEFVEENKAIGIGEIGRIHFPVEEIYQNACDEQLRQAFKMASGVNCPVILHTESYHSNPELMKHLSRMIDSTSLHRSRVVKHYSGPDLILPEDNLGISLSLQCRKDTVKKVFSSDFDHLWETDYIDDPKRPNVVMPPDMVPKKIKWAHSQGFLDDERHARSMIDLPKRVLGIGTDL